MHWEWVPYKERLQNYKVCRARLLALCFVEMSNSDRGVLRQESVENSKDKSMWTRFKTRVGGISNLKARGKWKQEEGADHRFMDKYGAVIKSMHGAGW